MSDRPAVTKMTHSLPFERLSPTDFERLCFWLVRREGFEDAQYIGAKGNDQGRDIIGTKEDRRVVFQCKRVERFQPADAEKEIAKLLALPAETQPLDLIFIVTSEVTAETRDRASLAWKTRGSCSFWAATELDERVKSHQDILGEFFELSHAESPSFEAHLAGEGAVAQGDAAVTQVQIEGSGFDGSGLVFGNLTIQAETIAFGGSGRPPDLPRASTGRVSTTPPALPSHYIARPEAFAALKGTLLADEDERRGGGAVGVLGMGGVGKTVLVQAMVEDQEIKGMFPDGVLWVTVGQHPDLMEILSLVARAVDSVETVFNSVAEGRYHLEETLKQRRLLLVLDDVWNTSDGEALRLIGRNGRVLVTTRNKEVLDALAATVQRVDSLGPKHGLELLSFSAFEK